VDAVHVVDSASGDSIDQPRPGGRPVWQAIVIELRDAGLSPSGHEGHWRDARRSCRPVSHREWTLKVMANLLDDDEKGAGEAAYRMLATMVRPLPVG
jgi:hypothetical protein